MNINTLVKATGSRLGFLIFASFCLPAQAETNPAISSYENKSPEYIMVAAHRGGYMSKGKVTHPENSLAAMKHSIALGADILEVDVRMTADKQLIIMHDSTVNRTTTGKGKVSAMSLDEIRQLKLKGPNKSISKEIPPTLKEVMLLAKGKAMVNLDKTNINDTAKFELIMKTLIETDTVDHAIFKGGATPEQIQLAQAKFPEHPITYMPIVGNQSAETMLQVLQQQDPRGIEVIFNKPDTPMLSKQVIDQSRTTHLWVNTLWASLCAGRHDAVAIKGNPDASWGWVVDHGATIIQTDNVPQLIDYLKSRNLRQ